MWLENLRNIWNKRQNTRLYRRTTTSDISVKIYVKGKSEPIVERIGNWSPGGLFINTTIPIPMETMVNLEFSLSQNQTSLIQLQAQVVTHKENKKTGEVEGMGLMFTDFTQVGLVILRELLINTPIDE